MAPLCHLCVAQKTPVKGEKLPSDTPFAYKLHVEAGVLGGARKGFPRWRLVPAGTGY